MVVAQSKHTSIQEQRVPGSGRRDAPQHRMAVLVLLCRKDLADAVLLETPETPGRVRHTVRIKPLIDDRPTKKRRKRRKRHPPTVRQAAHRTPRDEHGSNDSAPQQHAGLARIRRGVNAGWKRDKCMHACSQQCMHAVNSACMQSTVDRPTCTVPLLLLLIRMLLLLLLLPLRMHRGHRWRCLFRQRGLADFPPGVLGALSLDRHSH